MLFDYEITNRSHNLLGRGNDGCFQRRAVRRRGECAVQAADRRIEIVEAGVGNCGRQSRLRSRTGPKASSTISSRPVLCTEAQDRLHVERRDRARIDQLDRDALAGQLGRRPSSA